MYSCFGTFFFSFMESSTKPSVTDRRFRRLATSQGRLIQGALGAGGQAAAAASENQFAVKDAAKTSKVRKSGGVKSLLPTAASETRARKSGAGFMNLGGSRRVFIQSDFL